MLTIVNGYYCNEGMLQKQYENFRSLPEDLRRQIEYCVTDDSTPEPYRKAWGEDIPDMKVQVFHGTGPDIAWNYAFARNVGCKHASYPLLLVTDIDHMVTEDFLRYLIKAIHEGRIFGTFDETDAGHRVLYKPTHRIRSLDGSRYKPHPDTYLCTKYFWCDILGYHSERFRGGYGGDYDHKERLLRRARIDEKTLDVGLYLWDRENIADASTFNLDRKSPEQKARVRKIRNDLIRKGEHDKPAAFLAPSDYEKVYP